MKYIIEVDSAGMVYHQGIHLFTISMPTTLEPYNQKELQPVSLNKIIKLKESGFDSDEIMKMNAEGML